MAEWLFGKEPTLDRNQHRAPCSNSPTGRDDALRTHALQVRILLGAPRLSSPTAEAACSKQVTVRVQILPQAPIHARLAQRQSGALTQLRSGFRNSQRVPVRVLSSAI